MNRRHFLSTSGLALASLSLSGPGTAEAADVKSASASSIASASARHLPKWRGFNLLEKFIARKGGNAPFQEQDFALMAEWGFDFARLPLSYHCWSEPDPARWLEIREDEIRHVDQAVEWGRTHGVHVNINLHRAPGYCVNPPAEPLDLWTEDRALEACAHHWAYFARRYKGIPNDRVSFDLLNEPADVSEATYVKVVKRLVEAIRAEDPGRLIVADGRRWGRDPVHSLIELGIGQSTRGYDPMRVSHWKANWVKGSDTWPEPTWPLKESETSVWDKERLRRERIQPWKDLATKGVGVGVHVGEWGAYNKTPHPVVLAWMRDQLELWKEAGWGWALWNLRGDFGPLNSRRSDIKYEAYRGLQLDRQMLELLRRF